MSFEKKTLEKKGIQWKYFSKNSIEKFESGKMSGSHNLFKWRGGGDEKYWN